MSDSSKLPCDHSSVLDCDPPICALCGMALDDNEFEPPPRECSRCGLVKPAVHTCLAKPKVDVEIIASDQLPLHPELARRLLELARPPLIIVSEIVTKFEGERAAERLEEFGEPFPMTFVGKLVDEGEK